MTISAIIPSFNRLRYLPRAIDSILNQTIPIDEVVVVDDGSTDETAEVIAARYGSRVRLIRQENTGVAGARWRGIRETRGEWIAFLDSDDEWVPERTADLLRAALQVPEEVAWVFGDLRVVTDQGEGPTLFEEHGLSIVESPQVFSDSLSIQYPFQFPMLQSSLIRRRVLIELDCFSEGLRSDDDLLAGFQVACRYQFAAIPSIVGKYFRTSDLASTSVVVNGNFGRDYYRSRMIAFSRVIETGRRRPWNARYASEVRGLCQFLARQGQSVRKLAWQQFRFGAVSVKSMAFFCASLLGHAGLTSWDWLAQLYRNRFAKKIVKQLPKNGLQAYFQSAANKPS